MRAILANLAAVVFATAALVGCWKEYPNVEVLLVGLNTPLFLILGAIQGRRDR